MSGRNSIIEALEAEQMSKEVPEVLLSGDHKRIAEWRQEQALERTKQRRPDLINRIDTDN